MTSRKIIVGIAVFILFGTGAVSLLAQASAVAAAKAFYTQHFRARHLMYFTHANVRRERRWFTPRLYKLMRYELQRADANRTDEDGNLMKGHINGDVFTDSESPPQVFRIGRSIQKRNWTTVEVHVYWNDNSIGKMRRKVTLRLLPIRKRWLIDNVIYESGPDLVTDLSRRDYFSDR